MFISELTEEKIIDFIGKFEILDEKFLLIPMAFDIETTNDFDSQAAYMYIWQFAINDNVIFGRTWDEFIYLNKLLIKTLKLEKYDKQLVVFVHNLSYEWQFMRKYLNKNFNLHPFFLDNRKPVYVGLGYKEGQTLIEYRDSYMLSQCGLKKTAETYCKTQKLPDFDYDIKRNHLTELTERELEYCANDVLILTEFYQYYIENIIIPKQFFPITQTQIPRNDVKNAWRRWKRGKYNPNKKYISNLFPKDYKEYKNIMDYLFRGGYTHANAENANIKIEDDILHIDFTSSYPAVLLHDYFPISKFIPIKYDEKYLKTHCCRMLVEFTDIEAKTAICYDSISKAVYMSEDTEDDNGRLFKSSKYIAYLTELDYEIYEKVYNWKEKKILKFSIAEKGDLPDYLRNIIIEYYSMKSKIKKYGEPKGKDKLRYEYSKRMVNAIYGMMCTRLNVMDLNYVDDEYVVTDVELDWYNVKIKSFLSPYWGIWCTAHARFHVMELICNLIDKHKTEWYYYSDTDSHFCKDTPYIRNYIKEYNEKIAEQNKEFGELLNDLGEFDLEHCPEKNPIYAFKTLGAKRYLIKTKKGYEATIAGLPKTFIAEDGKEYNLLEYIGNEKGIDPFDYFTNNMLLDEFISHKNANYYNDNKTTAIINGVKEESLSSVYIFPITFKLFMKMKYCDFIVKQQSIKEERIKG